MKPITLDVVQSPGFDPSAVLWDASGAEVEVLSGGTTPTILRTATELGEVERVPYLWGVVEGMRHGRQLARCSLAQREQIL